MNDKALHMIAGLIISLVVGCIYSPHVGWLYGSLVGFTASFVAGIGKEMWDSCGHGTVDLQDALATIQGGCIGGLLVILVTYVLG